MAAAKAREDDQPAVGGKARAGRVLGQRTSPTARGVDGLDRLPARFVLAQESDATVLPWERSRCGSDQRDRSNQ